MVRNKKVKIYNCLRAVFTRLGLNDLLKIIENTDSEKVGLNYIGVSIDDQKMISYIPNSKKAKYSDENYDNIFFTESEKARMERQKIGVKTKIGRIISKFVDSNEYEKEIQKMSSYFSTVNDGYYFEIVSGEDIRTLYHSDYYHDHSGTLAKSCMGPSKCQPFFDLYVDHAKMLILKKQGDQNHVIRGRAILWDDVSVTQIGSGDTTEEAKISNSFYFSDKKKMNIKYMDRPYCCPSNISLFNSWASENGYFCSGATFSGNFNIASPIPNEPRLSCLFQTLSVVTPKEYALYPYLDTFQSGMLNDDGTFTIHSGKERTRNLAQTDGCIVRTCSCCGESIFQGFDSNNYYSEYLDSYYCEDCGSSELTYVDELDDYYPNEMTSYCDCCGESGLSDDMHCAFDENDKEITACSSCVEDYVYVESEMEYHSMNNTYYCEGCAEHFLLKDKKQHTFEDEEPDDDTGEKTTRCEYCMTILEDLN